jgi:hypothetical protein
MPRISSPRPLDLTKPFITSSQSYGSQPIDLSQGLVTWYRDIQGDFVPDLSGRGNTARCGGIGSNDKVTGSNDIPEYNPLNYPIRSFDLASNDTSPNVQHIRSVNDSGIATSYEDHTFTDGTQDIPFSVSFWVKLDTTSGAQYIISKGSTTSGQYEWSIYNSSNTLTVYLFSQGNAADHLRATLASAFPGSRNGWDHFVITYDGESSILCYRNGSSQTLTLVNSSFSSMKTSSYGLFLGVGFQYPDLRTDDLNGKLHSISIWKNRVINPVEALELYNAYINGSGGEARSGFISRSPRLLLRELDDLPGSYPTVRRVGDPTRSGALSSNFNDETVIVFSEAGNVVFPTMLPKGSSFASQAVDIIGQESDISASLPIRSFQQPTYLHYSPTEVVGPFNENRVMPATDFFLSGTDPNVLPGFTSPTRSKIAIEIDITPQSDTMVMRNVSRRNTAEGAPVAADNTGFLYYNFADREWDQVGATDPFNGSPIYYDFSYTGGSQALSTGSFPYQFTSAPAGLAVVLSSSYPDIMNTTGYQKIGTPTATMGAPSLLKYHARDPQSLKLSEYINAPFLLEKISVNFKEVNAQRVNGQTPPDTVAAGVFKSGSIRDIDNYVFFLYRQNRSNREKDTVFDVSSSVRHLIASASMTFWNSPSLSGSGLTHGPAFDYDFNLPLNDSYAVGSFTGSLSLNFQPAVCGPQFLNPSFVMDNDGVGTKVIINSWPGSTSIQNYPSDFYNFYLGTLLPDIVLENESVGSFAARMSRLDHRATRKFGGENSTPSEEPLFTIRISTETPQSNPSPYLLLPGDELVIGLEAGVSPTYAAGNFSHITGSFMRVLNERCTVTLYGSTIKDSIAHHPSLNQDLSSNSVHEIVGAEPALDQFQIEPISSYFGSYLDEIVTGSMATPQGVLSFSTASQDQSRRVISRVSLGQAGTTGSLQRFAKMSDANERTYDSCLPNALQFLGDAVTFLNSTEKSDIAFFVSPYDTEPSEGSLFYPKQFPFQDNPTRFILQKNGSLRSLALFITIGETPKIDDAPLVEDIVFRTGWIVELVGGVAGHRTPIARSAGKSQRQRSYGRAYRYGISSTTPEFSSSRWRSDHYGYFRDMLEPRQNVTTFNRTPPIKIKFVSGSDASFPALNTHSQNLSTFATSSLPYFDDGIARNRDDNPDDMILV